MVRIQLNVLFVLSFALAIGCSTGGVTDIPLPEGEQQGISRETTTSNAHGLLGLYQFTADPNSSTLDVAQLRLAEGHLNVLPFLEPPALVNLTLESLEFNGNIIEVDIGLRHPFLGLHEFSGFDVCGILISHGSPGGFTDTDLLMPGVGDTRLLNPDGWSRWWNPGEFAGYVDGILGTPDSMANFTATLNGYKYYSDELAAYDEVSFVSLTSRGLFSAGQKNIRHFSIEMGGGLVFNYAIDANWAFPNGAPPYQAPDDFPPEANRPEAYNISVSEIENTLFYEDATGYGGGSLTLHVGVWDHFDSDLNTVHLESPAGIPLISSDIPIDSGAGYSVFEFVIQGQNLTRNGDADLFITVESESMGYGGNLTGEPVCAYFRGGFSIGLEGLPGWGHNWGASTYDEGQGITTDADGNIYVTGYFGETVDFDPDPDDEYLKVANGLTDIFLIKFDPSGDFMWVNTWGGTNTDYGLGVAIADDGSIIMTGFFVGPADFDPDPVDSDIHLGVAGWDVYMCSFDPDGDYLGAQTWGGPANDIGWHIAVDSSGNTYIIGFYENTADFDPGGTTDYQASNGGRDIFLTKFNFDGVYEWTRTWGGGGDDFGFSVDVDSSGNAYTVGFFYVTVDFDPDPVDEDFQSSNGNSDIFLSKIDSTGNFQWARTWGSNTHERGRGIAVDDTGNSFVTGYFRSMVDFDPGPGEEIIVAQGHSDVFLSKFNASGEYQWVRVWGGSSNLPDSGYEVELDSQGAIYITGDFWGNVDFDPGTGYDPHISEGQNDIFLSKLDSNGDFEWARTWGGYYMDDFGQDVAVDINDNPCVTGSFYGSTADFDPGPEVEMHNSAGYRDAFLIKLRPDGYW